MIHKSAGKMRKTVDDVDRAVVDNRPEEFEVGIIGGDDCPIIRDDTIESEHPAGTGDRQCSRVINISNDGAATGDHRTRGNAELICHQDTLLENDLAVLKLNLACTCIGDRKSARYSNNIAGSAGATEHLLRINRAAHPDGQTVAISKLTKIEYSSLSPARRFQQR